jgi:hypothetical protein
MKYSDGTEARLGDQVRLSNGEQGTVVFSVDANEYSTDFPREEWNYLAKGIMIKTDSGALVHYEDPNMDEVALLKAKYK